MNRIHMAISFRCNRHANSCIIKPSNAAKGTHNPLFRLFPFMLCPLIIPLKALEEKFGVYFPMIKYLTNYRNPETLKGIPAYYDQPKDMLGLYKRKSMFWNLHTDSKVE